MDRLQDDLLDAWQGQLGAAPPGGLRLDDIAMRVAAWHNRHPLAQRITPAQVQGVGWVALPFAQRPGAAPLAGDDLPTLADALPAMPATGAAPDLPPPPSATRLRDRAQARAGSAPAPAQPAAPAPPRLPWPQRLLQGAKAALLGAQAALQGLAALADPRTLRARWQQAGAERRRLRSRQRALQAAYSEDFIAPLKPARTARWALLHGRLHPQRAGLPLREVLADARWQRQGSALTQLYLPTAAIELGPRRVRLLLAPPGAGGGLQAIGPRLYSRQRATALAAGLLLVAAALARPSLPPMAAWPTLASVQAWPGVGPLQALVRGWLQPAAAPAAAALAPGPADAASGAAAAPADAAASALEGVAGTGPQPAAGEASGAAAAATLGAWPDVTAGAASAALPGLADPGSASPAPNGALADTGAVALAPDDPPPPPLPPRTEAAGASLAAPVTAAPARPWARPLVPPLDEATKAAARQTVADLRAARGDPPVPPASSPAAPPASPRAAASPPPAAAAAEIGPTFALTTRPLRTRAESEQVAAAVRALMDGHTREPVLVELMPAGEDWRVVCWPFLRRQDAQLARALLLTRGLRLETVEF